MATLRKEKDSWVVDFHWNNKHTQRSFKSKLLAEKVLALLEGWKDIQRAQEFIRDAIAEGMMNPEQKAAFEAYINRMASDLTEGQKIQIQSMLSDYQKMKKIIACVKCSVHKPNYAKGMCKKCYMADFELKG